MSGRQGHRCEDYHYYDSAISTCTPCDHLCDDHAIQGTTDQCKAKCSKYYQRMQESLQKLSTQTTTVYTSNNFKPNNSNGPGWNQDNAIIVGVVVGLILIFGFAAVLLFRRKNYKICCLTKKKTPVMCSNEDGINAIESQKSLLHSNGPVCQAEENPQHGTDQAHWIKGTHGLRIMVLDRPLISGNMDTALPRAYTGSSHFSHVSIIGHSTLPNTDSGLQCPTNGTNVSSSTIPKVVFTSEDESDMNSQQSRTIAEHSLDLESFGNV